jgi:Uma2 family endonuclease
MMLWTSRIAGSTMAISERADTAEDFAPSPWVGQRMTLREFLALPEEEPPLEFDGEVVTQKMAPTPDHIEVQAIFREAFNNAASEHRLGRAFFELRFRVGSVVRVPDVGYYRRERLQIRQGRRYERNLGVPDIAVEIVSPDQSVTSLIRKCQEYLALGSQIALVVDLDEAAVLAFRPGQPVRVLQGHDRIDVDEVLPAFALTVHELFEAIVPSWVAQSDTGQSKSDVASGSGGDQAEDDAAE